MTREVYSFVKGLVLTFFLVLSLVSVQAIANPNAPAADVQHTVQGNGEPEGIITLRCNNGISARIFTAHYLKTHMKSTNSGATFSLSNGYTLDFITDIHDPLIHNRGDGAFHPFKASYVMEAIKAITYPGAPLDLEIYILPYPRRNILVSSSLDNIVFLSPHVMNIPVEVNAYIVTHEIGHSFQHRYMPEEYAAKWKEYKKRRNIENSTKFSERSSHAYRPKEIFAEDFRVLFGGWEAQYGGYIENPELLSPRDVNGLEHFFLTLSGARDEIPAIVSLDNYPNPFNPITEIQIVLTDEYMALGEKVMVEVYDVKGSLVRQLYRDVPTSRELRINWNGRNDRGASVASGVYFCLVSAGNSKTTRKLHMLK